MFAFDSKKALDYDVFEKLFLSDRHVRPEQAGFRRCTLVELAPGGPMMLEAILSRAWRTMPISALLLLLPVSIVVANSQGAPATAAAC